MYVSTQQQKTKINVSQKCCLLSAVGPILLVLVGLAGDEQLSTGATFTLFVFLQPASYITQAACSFSTTNYQSLHSRISSSMFTLLSLSLSRCLPQQSSSGLLLALILHASLFTFNKEWGRNLSEHHSAWQAWWACWVSLGRSGLYLIWPSQSRAGNTKFQT